MKENGYKTRDEKKIEIMKDRKHTNKQKKIF